MLFLYIHRRPEISIKTRLSVGVSAAERSFGRFDLAATSLEQVCCLRSKRWKIFCGDLLEVGFVFIA